MTELMFVCRRLAAAHGGTGHTADRCVDFLQDEHFVTAPGTVTGRLIRDGYAASWGPKSVRSLESPRRMRLLAVPSGTPTFCEISSAVMPPQ